MENVSKHDSCDIDCTFCAEFLGEDFGNLFRNRFSIDDFPTRVIWQNENFVIMPTLGAFAVGYVLILTQKHIPSLSYLNNEEFDDLNLIINKIRNIYEERYGGCVFFEHGAMTKYRKGGGCCEDHAHLHVLPFNAQFYDIVSKLFPVRKINDLRELKENEKNEMPYMMFTTHDNDIFVADAIEVTSQFLRQIASSQIGMPDTWNWRIFPMIENVRATFDDLTPILKQFNYK